MRRTLAVAVASAALVFTAGAANADLAPAWTDDPPMAGNQHQPAVCDFAQFWTAGECAGHPPTIRDPRPRFVRVKRHDTLWHLSVVWLGSGHNWHQLARMNHIHGTTIHVGQTLRIR